MIARRGSGRSGGFVHLLGRDEDASTGVAALPGVHAHAEEVATDGLADISGRQDDVGRLAAEFLCDTLDRGSSVLGDLHAGGSSR